MHEALHVYQEVVEEEYPMIGNGYMLLGIECQDRGHIKMLCTIDNPSEQRCF